MHHVHISPASFGPFCSWSNDEMIEPAQSIAHTSNAILNSTPAHIFAWIDANAQVDTQGPLISSVSYRPHTDPWSTRSKCSATTTLLEFMCKHIRATAGGVLLLLLHVRPVNTIGESTRISHGGGVLASLTECGGSVSIMQNRCAYANTNRLLNPAAAAAIAPDETTTNGGNNSI